MNASVKSSLMGIAFDNLHARLKTKVWMYAAESNMFNFMLADLDHSYIIHSCRSLTVFWVTTYLRPSTSFIFVEWEWKPVRALATAWLFRWNSLNLCIIEDLATIINELNYITINSYSHFLRTYSTSFNSFGVNWSQETSVPIEATNSLTSSYNAQNSHI